MFKESQNDDLYYGSSCRLLNFEDSFIEQEYPYTSCFDERLQRDYEEEQKQECQNNEREGNGAITSFIDLLLTDENNKF